MSDVANLRGNQLFFWCPGCNRVHAPKVIGDGAWGWNQSLTAPTITPSILAQWNHGEEQKRRCCHSFVTDGKIQYLGDCTHALANQTIPIPPWNGYFNDGNLEE